MVFEQTFKFTCKCGECRIRMRKNIDPNIREYVRGSGVTEAMRAGVFIHTKGDAEKVLIVQSYDWKWGPPKGKIEDGESARECALRETVEETGITLDKMPIFSTQFHQKWTMYDVTLDRIKFFLPQSDEITGIGWVSTACMVHNRDVLNYPCKLCLRKFMSVNI